MGLPVVRDWTAFLVFPDPKEIPDHRASLVILAKKVIVETTACPDCLVSQE
jgi:hypothetical protein